MSEEGRYPKIKVVKGNIMIPVISFIGYANSGKTTLITQVVSILDDRGYEVGVLKHHHGSIPLEEGKDTTQYMDAGAKKAVLVGDYGYVTFGETQLSEIIETATKDVNLLIIEGFKQEDFLKIEVQGDGKERLGIPVIALVTNQETDEEIPVFKHGEVEPLVVFLEGVMKEMKRK